jgi:NDP-sugar pyrophosphorylase family protein
MERERLTITLKPRVIKYIDSLVDGVEIRNRSHAIETIISRTMTPGISQALILAAGQGIKMRPFTYEIPKPMMPVKGQPILEHIVEQLRDSDIRDITIVIGYLGEQIRSHFGDGSKFGVKIRYIEEDVPTGTAGPLRIAQNVLAEKSFLMLYGDVLADINIRQFIDFHLQYGQLATLALTSVPDPSAYGVVRMNGHRIVDLVEKPKKNSTTSRLVAAGIQILTPAVYQYIPHKTFSMLEEDVFPALAKEGKLVGYLFEGKWFDVGTPDVYARALKEWAPAS